jgi:hypothetical protein
LELRGTRNAVDLSIDRSWLGAHPLTQHLLEEESTQWERAGSPLVLHSL